VSADVKSLLEPVEEVARVAGGVALRHFKSEFRVESKQDGTPVTIADRSAEQAAREWITTRFPRDGILGEELGEHLPDAPRRWILDPIDGTKTFVRGVPLWGTLVALCDGSTVLAGAVFIPVLDEMLVAAVGEGCWWNGRRAHVSSVSQIAQATVLTSEEGFSKKSELRDAWRRLADRAAVSRTWADCYGYALVATGRAEVIVDPVMAPWDSAAVFPVITEAGGVFTDLTGKSTALGGSAVATNAALASQARELLGVPTGAAP
jgi:histidinol-phosphatase